MTNKKQLIAILSLTSILITSGFSLTPFAYSTGSNYGYDQDDDEHSNKYLKCTDNGNLIDNGCFEIPAIPSANTKKWDIYDKMHLPTGTTDDAFGWEVYWLKDHPGFPADPVNPCILPEIGYSSTGLLELQRGILGGPAEGKQHAELDSDCNGPNSNTRNDELSSVGIYQTFATSENNDYKITFAYKARPDQDIGTNGLRVIWNEGDITGLLQPAIGFSKKDWKYASITVPGITSESTKLAFEDTGNPSDSLGTFIDDVSVFPIPKPMSSITLKKAFTNDNNGMAAAEDFPLKIKNVNAPYTEYTFPPLPLGSDTKDVPAGTYTMSETSPLGYSFVLIAGDDACPAMLDSESFTLKKGEHTTCVIYNDDDRDGPTPTVDPPTIKIINKVEGDPYTITVTPNSGSTGSDPIYTVPSHTPITIANPDGDDRSILITGDGNCPENVGGFVNIENGQHITCTYSDRPVVEQNGAGVIFHYDTLQFNSESATCTDGGSLPCIADYAGSFIIVPDLENDNSVQELTQTTLILLTVMDTVEPTNDVSCRITGIATESNTLMTGFVMKCTDLFNTNHAFNANWALIETNPDA